MSLTHFYVFSLILFGLSTKLSAKIIEIPLKKQLTQTQLEELNFIRFSYFSEYDEESFYNAKLIRAYLNEVNGKLKTWEKSELKIDLESNEFKLVGHLMNSFGGGQFLGFSITDGKQVLCLPCVKEGNFNTFDYGILSSQQANQLGYGIEAKAWEERRKDYLQNLLNQKIQNCEEEKKLQLTAKKICPPLIAAYLVRRAEIYSSNKQFKDRQIPERWHEDFLVNLFMERYLSVYSIFKNFSDIEQVDRKKVASKCIALNGWIDYSAVNIDLNYDNCIKKAHRKKVEQIVQTASTCEGLHKELPKMLKIIPEENGLFMIKLIDELRKEEFQLSESDIEFCKQFAELVRSGKKKCEKVKDMFSEYPCGTMTCNSDKSVSIEFSFKE